MTTNELRNQISNNFNLKETDELLDIWQTNDRVEWSDDAFEVISEILKKRDVELPEQDEPVYEHNKEYTEGDDDDFSEVELKIIDDENPPEFYDAFEVLKASKWIEIAAKISIGISIALGLIGFPSTQNIVLSYFHGDTSWGFAEFIITLVIVSVGVTLQILTTYFPLMALARILKVLMEMEFNSRKAK